MKRLVAIPMFLLMTLLVSPTPAFADSVTLTSGGVFYHQDDPLFVFLPSLQSVIVAGDDSGNLLPGCMCAPGDIVDTSTSEEMIGGGSFVYQGTTYQVSNSASFTIDSGEVAVPDVPASEEGTQFGTVFTPFTFRGTLTGVSATGLTTSLELTGRGTTAFTFSRSLGANPQFFSAFYAFENASAVPEPSTLLLVGGAVAAAATRRFRARRG
jgi:hypothetical protein